MFSISHRTLSSLPCQNRYSCNPIIHYGRLINQQQKRTFLDSLLKSGLGECRLRSLSHTKVIPYSANSTFQAVADVSGYPSFLPFTISCDVISRDDNGYPTRAKLKIGYEKLGIEENWDSIVHCDPQKGLVEAQSSEKGSGGLFEVLKTRWQMHDHDKQQTLVKLHVDVKFRNALYDQMFAQVEEKVAATMISAFEKKVKEIDLKTDKR